MKRIVAIVSMLIFMMMTVACASNTSMTQAGQQQAAGSQGFQMKTKVLFINASENRDGNTSRMAKSLLGNTPYDQLNLVDYRVDSLGQHFDGDQFDVVLKAMQQADVIVIGTPVYWHTMSGSLKNVIDRMYTVRNNANLTGKQMYFITQGTAPTPESIQQLKWTMNRFGEYFGMDVKGLAANDAEVEVLRNQLNR
jgi:possible flavodoxin protein